MRRVSGPVRTGQQHRPACPRGLVGWVQGLTAHCTHPSFPEGAQASSQWLEFPGSLLGLRTVLAMVSLPSLSPLAA